MDFRGRRNDNRSYHGESSRPKSTNNACEVDKYAVDQIYIRMDGIYVCIIEPVTPKGNPNERVARYLIGQRSDNSAENLAPGKVGITIDQSKNPTVVYFNTTRVKTSSVAELNQQDLHYIGTLTEKASTKLHREYFDSLDSF